MVIGQGLLAAAFSAEFSQTSDVIIFASGVSNSQEIDPLAFKREKLLLQEAKTQPGMLVYFSSCSLYDKSLQKSPYVIHKQKMEALVNEAPHRIIFRLPQVVGKTSNPKTLTNFLYNKIMTGEHFNIWRYAKRNLVDVEDLALIAGFIINDSRLKNQTLNIAAPTAITLLNLVKIFESVLRKKAVFSLIDEGGEYDIEPEPAASIANSLGINFEDNYIEKVIKKYYGQ
jgi:nucleoside-diphosphate-sugar epimerase